MELLRVEGRVYVEVRLVADRLYVFVECDRSGAGRVVLRCVFTGRVYRLSFVRLSVALRVAGTVRVFE